jgi:hypothetical protein
LQLFASDVSPDAVAYARNGLYPEAVKANISEGWLSRFFTHEHDGYRVRPDLRDCIVFTIQDLLSDPPFSHLALICCRNLLIYLQPDEQEKVLGLFHFALQEGGPSPRELQGHRVERTEPHVAPAAVRQAISEYPALGAPTGDDRWAAVDLVFLVALDSRPSWRQICCRHTIAPRTAAIENHDAQSFGVATTAQS